MPSEFRVGKKIVLGHKEQKNLLAHLVTSDRTPHALLFNGPAGVGKRTLARAFIEKLILSKLPDELKQTAQSSLASGQYPDLHQVWKEPESKDLPVDSIRELRDSLQLSPYYPSYKIALIDNAHQMSIAAANALLKTLEEPTNNTLLILVSDSIHRLPETIVSRCQIVNFSTLSQADLSIILKDIGESAGINKKDLASLSELCQESLAPLLLERFIDPLSLNLSEPDEAKKHLEELCKATESKIKLIKSIVSKNKSSRDAISLAQVLSEDKENLGQTFSLFRNEIRKSLRSSEDKIPELSQSLLDCIECERLIKERNAQAELQLASFLLKLA